MATPSYASHTGNGKATFDKLLHSNSQQLSQGNFFHLLPWPLPMAGSWTTEHMPPWPFLHWTPWTLPTPSLHLHQWIVPHCNNKVNPSPLHWYCHNVQLKVADWSRHHNSFHSQKMSKCNDHHNHLMAWVASCWFFTMVISFLKCIPSISP